MGIVKHKHNQHWKREQSPEVTVVTPFFNRGYCLERVFRSVNNQTYRNFEYIIVDDGSVENNDSIVEAFMDDVDFPVLYIKKENGGVHTARNIAIKNSRGKYIVCIDSDDELVPEALQMMTDVWMEIPEEIRDEFFEVKFRCKDMEGIHVGPAFPENLNLLPYKKRIKKYERIGSEHIGVRRGDIMRANPWPEPAGITFVTENILWCTLRRKYKSYFTNEIARIYHTEMSDSITKKNNSFKTIKTIKNTYWNVAYYLNHWDIFYGFDKIFPYFRDILRYSIFEHILSWKIGKHEKYLKGVWNKVMAFLFWLPSSLPAYIYVKKRLKE